MSAESKEREAGTTLDGEIHVRIMGLSLGRCGGVMTDAANGSSWSCNKCSAYDDHGPFEHDAAPPAYSADIAAAWVVVEKMREHPDPRFRNLRLIAYAYNRTYATFDAENEDDWTEANGEFATPLAICLAALEALPASTPQSAVPTPPGGKAE